MHMQLNILNIVKKNSKLVEAWQRNEKHKLLGRKTFSE